LHRLSTPLLYSVRANSIESGNGEEQLKLENERLKEKNSFQEETMKKMQSECDALKNQVKEMERLKEREALQREMIEKLTVENKQLSKQMTELQVARSKLENSAQHLQNKVESMTVQMESAENLKKVKIEHVEALNKDLQKQITELKITLSQQQTQATQDHSKHQKEVEKYQQKCEQMENQVQEKDIKLSNIEGKMESTLKNLQQIQEILNLLDKKEEQSRSDCPTSLHEEEPVQVTISKNGIECFKQKLMLKCSKQDLVDIIEAHIEEIETLHHVLYTYHCKIDKMQLKLKCII